MTDQQKAAMLDDLANARRCLDMATEQVEAGGHKLALQWLALVAQYVSLSTDKLPRDVAGVEHMRDVWTHANMASNASLANLKQGVE